MTSATARINFKKNFSIAFSLSEVFKTDHFVARQEKLNIIYKTLSDGFNRRVVIFHNLEKISKTQLAVAYIKAHYKDYSATLWLNIKNKISVKQNYFRIAKQILRKHFLASQLGTIINKSKSDEIMAAVKRWLKYFKNT